MRLQGLACKTAETLIGGPVTRVGREIGVITASGWYPFLDRGVAYVRLSDADDATLGPVEVLGFDLALHQAEIVALPFCDAEKRIARGLEAPSV